MSAMDSAARQVVDRTFDYFLMAPTSTDPQMCLDDVMRQKASCQRCERFVQDWSPYLWGLGLGSFGLILYLNMRH